MHLHHLVVKSRSTFDGGGHPEANTLRDELSQFVQSCGAVAASANQWAQQVIDKVGGPRTEKALRTGDGDARIKAILSLNAASGIKLPAGLSIATETRKRPRIVLAAQLRLDLSVFKSSSSSQLSLLEEVNARSGPGVVLVDPSAAKPFLGIPPLVQHELGMVVPRGQLSFARCQRMPADQCAGYDE